MKEVINLFKRIDNTLNSKELELSSVSKISNSKTKKPEEIKNRCY